MYGGPNLTPNEFFQKLKKICSKHYNDETGACRLCPLKMSEKCKPWYLCYNLFDECNPPCQLEDELINELILKVYEMED